MASRFLRRKSSGSATDGVIKGTGTVLHEGFATKESGSSLFGKTNWRKRWFRLVQRSDVVTLEYYRSRRDPIPAGYVKLNVTYCTRPLETYEKSHPNCFAVGPMLEDGATRTYYISCSDKLVMQEWIAVIDAAIQGVPEQAKRRKATVNNLFAMKYKEKLKKIRERAHVSVSSSISSQDEDIEQSIDDPFDQSLFNDDPKFQESMPSCVIPNSLTREELNDEEMMEELDDELSEDEEERGLEEEVGNGGATALSSSSRLRRTPDSGLTVDQKRACYLDPTWRLQQWQTLCSSLQSIEWTKSDTKEGITVARSKFGRSSKGYAVMKVEGTLPANPRNVFNFLQLSTKEGGKLDYLFRNEYLAQEITSEPKATVVYNEIQPPLPRVSIRDIVAMKVWVPPGMSMTEKFGFVMFSVEHPDIPPPESGYTRIGVDISGIVLSPYPGPNNEVHTKMTMLVQVAFYGAMHKMLKGAYNSGLLKLGFRTTFSLIAEQLERYIQITNI